MKYFFVTILGGCISLVIGTIAISPIVNNLYVRFYSLEPGPDKEAELANVLIFIEWPIFFILGGIVSYLSLKFYLTSSSK